MANTNYDFMNNDDKYKQQNNNPYGDAPQGGGMSSGGSMTGGGQEGMHDYYRKQAAGNQMVGGPGAPPAPGRGGGGYNSFLGTGQNMQSGPGSSAYAPGGGGSSTGGSMTGGGQEGMHDYYRKQAAGNQMVGGPGTPPPAGQRGFTPYGGSGGYTPYGGAGPGRFQQSNPYANVQSRAYGQEDPNEPWNGGFPPTYTPPYREGAPAKGMPGGQNLSHAFGRGEGQVNPWETSKWRDEDWAKMIGDDFYEKMAFPYWDRAARDFQFRQEFGEGQRRYDLQYGLDRSDLEFNQWANQRDFGEDTRRWGKQFDFQRNQWRDTRGLLQQERDTAQHRANTERQLAETENMYREGLIDIGQYEARTNELRANLEHTAAMDQNQASRDVAGTYADAQRYGADQELAGTLGSARMYSGAQRYGAELGLQGQLGSAGLYSSAQRYGARLGLEGQLGAARMGLQGTLGSAQTYAGAQLGVAGMEQQTARERLAMERQQGLTRAEQMQLERERLASQEQQSRWGAFGRAQTPNARWARNWG